MVNLWTRSKAPFAHEQAARKALANGRRLTMPQLLVRGASWRAVMDLLAAGEVSIVGANDRARVIYERTEAS